MKPCAELTRRHGAATLSMTSPAMDLAIHASQNSPSSNEDFKGTGKASGRCTPEIDSDTLVENSLGKLMKMWAKRRIDSTLARTQPGDSCLNGGLPSSRKQAHSSQPNEFYHPHANWNGELISGQRSFEVRATCGSWNQICRPSCWSALMQATIQTNELAIVSPTALPLLTAISRLEGLHPALPSRAPNQPP